MLAKIIFLRYNEKEVERRVGFLEKNLCVAKGVNMDAVPNRSCQKFQETSAV